MFVVYYMVLGIPCITEDVLKVSLVYTDDEAGIYLEIFPADSVVPAAGIRPATPSLVT